MKSVRLVALAAGLLSAAGAAMLTLSPGVLAVSCRPFFWQATSATATNVTAAVVGR